MDSQLQQNTSLVMLTFEDNCLGSEEKHEPCLFSYGHFRVLHDSCSREQEVRSGLDDEICLSPH